MLSINAYSEIDIDKSEVNIIINSIIVISITQQLIYILFSRFIDPKMRNNMRSLTYKSKQNSMYNKFSVNNSKNKTNHRLYIKKKVVRKDIFHGILFQSSIKINERRS